MKIQHVHNLKANAPSPVIVGEAEIEIAEQIRTKASFVAADSEEEDELARQGSDV